MMTLNFRISSNIWQGKFCFEGAGVKISQVAIFIRKGADGSSAIPISQLVQHTHPYPKERLQQTEWGTQNYVCREAQHFLHTQLWVERLLNKDKFQYGTNSPLTESSEQSKTKIPIRPSFWTKLYDWNS